MSLASRVRDAVDRAPVVDIHTHLFAPEFGSLNLWGIDDLLTYHYLVAESLRAEPWVTPEDFYSWSKSHQADFIWEALFVRRTPLSEATTGVVNVLTAFNLDPTATGLHEARSFFESRGVRGHLESVMEVAGVASVVMTNDPLDPVERARWDDGVEPDPRFHAAFRIDPILNHWPDTAPKLDAAGGCLDQDIQHIRRYLDYWIDRMNPRYLAVSLPNTFSYPEDTCRDFILREAVLPTCQERGLPFAMMIGVRRAVNPRLRSAGDGSGVADLTSLERLASDYPYNRFLVTSLARENSHELCVLARKFANILPFGCWWFMNNPSIVEETTLMRLEMLGPTFVPQHSDARILDQLVYKWRHARTAIAAALTTRYLAIEEAGRDISDIEMDRDARALLGGIASEWLGVSI